MKILLLNDDFPPEAKGGAAILAAALAKALQKKGHEVMMITSTQNKEMEGVGQWEGLTVHRLYTMYPGRWRAYVTLYNPRTLPRVKKIIEEFKPDIINVHNVHSYLSYPVMTLAHKSGVPVVQTAHDTMLFAYEKIYEFIDPTDLTVHPTNFYSYKMPWWKNLKRAQKRFNPLRNMVIKYIVNRNVDTIIAMSKVHVQALAENGFPKSKLIYDGLSWEGWPASAEAVQKFKEKQGLLGSRVIFFGGRLSYLKGGEQAIHILSEVVKTHPNAVLVVAGRTNDYSDRMREIARGLGIDKNLIYAGWLSGEELRAAYGACELLLFPSIYIDLLGLVNLEAMAAGKPVVATCFGGASEVVLDGETGYVVNPFDIKTTAKRITELLDNPELSKKFGAVGRERALTVFSAERMVDEYLALFESLRKKRHAA